MTKVRASVKIWDGIFTQKSGSTGKEEEGEPGSGGEDFPSHSAVVVGHCLLEVLFISHISAAMCEGCCCRCCK